MKILILGSLHHKNKEGLELILNHCMNEIEWKWGTSNDLKYIHEYDVIYSCSDPIDSSKYPDKKFIFGPHFSVFPTQNLCKINNVHNNCSYIQPSTWVNNLWKSMNAESIIPVKTFSFPVNMERFVPLVNAEISKVFIYYKRRKPEELEHIKRFLNSKQIEYKVFDYVKRYDEANYLEYLQHSKYGIILDAHESQGFAIEEALSCNVPLLVWNTRFMSQEHGAKYPNIPCTTIPYWDERCGEFFYEYDEMEEKYNIFIDKLGTYQPRKYIEDNLNVEKCSTNFLQLL